MKTIWLVLAGAAGGVIAGMGMGGGTLTIPLLTLALGVEQKLAQAINLIAFVVMAAPVLVIHFKNRLVDMPALFKTAPPALAGSALCAWFAPEVPSEILARCFGGFLIVLGLWQAGKTVKQKMRSKKNFKPKSAPSSALNCRILGASGREYYPKQRFDE